jgi:hypothetical protein
MSIQNESDHNQLEELRQTVADLSTKIEVLNETIRTIGSLFSDYDLRVSECDNVTT